MPRMSSRWKPAARVAQVPANQLHDAASAFATLPFEAESAHIAAGLKADAS
jgi:hypothetical protein